MKEETWFWLIGLGVIGYYFYQQSLASATVAPAYSYSPLAVNAQQNEFQCPTGTHYRDSEISISSAGGYCA